MVKVLFCGVLAHHTRIEVNLLLRFKVKSYAEQV